MIRRPLLAGLAALALAVPAFAQTADPAAAADPVAAEGTALPSGDAAPPPPVTHYYAERLYPADEMAKLRAALMREHGGGSFHQILFNLAELQVRGGRTGYRWDGEGWFGGDVDRLVVKTEGEGTGHGVDGGEVQALYSRALDPYWDVQLGARHDFAPGRAANDATVGVHGVAPYWFETEAALFLSDKGLRARAEAYYDQLITQHLILQPRAELNFSAQKVPEYRIGSGLTEAELGLRLRYELSREFAPYVGVSYDRKIGGTARFSRLDGEKPAGASFVAGVRTWF